MARQSLFPNGDCPTHQDTAYTNLEPCSNMVGSHAYMSNCFSESEVEMTRFLILLTAYAIFYPGHSEAALSKERVEAATEYLQ